MVTFALPEEFASWRKRSGFRLARNGGGRIFRRLPADTEVAVLLTGAGAANAARQTRAALEAEPYDLVISSGFAGGLRPEHRPRAILVARSVRRHEDGAQLPVAGEWLERARRLGARAAVFVTANRVAVTAEEKRGLGAAADAVEMESFAVVAEAAARGIAAMAIRAVNDPVEWDLPVDFNRVFDGGGNWRAAKLAAELARRPTAIPGLWRLARESRRAAGELGEFLELYVSAAAAVGRGEEAGITAGR